jgi:hypothetical protein
MKNEAKGGGGGRPSSLNRGRMVAASFFDWLWWVAAHLVIGLGGRHGLYKKEKRR